MPTYNFERMTNAVGMFECFHNVHIFKFHYLVLFKFHCASSYSNFALIGVPYQLDQLANNQPKLSAFFALKSSKMSEDTFTNALCHVVSDVEDSSMRGGQSDSEDRHSSKVGEMIELSGQINTDSDGIVHENTNVNMMEELTSVRVKCDEEHAGGNSASTKDERNVEGELEPTHQALSTSFSTPSSDEQNVKEFPSSSATRPSKQGHSTLADPNFVENYFKVVKLELRRILNFHIA